VDTNRFDVGEFADELDRAGSNHEVGTKLLLKNDRVRVWDLDLAPGERVPFHCHATTYFFVCVDAGRGVSRFPDGNAVTLDYAAGDSWFDDVVGGEEIHDLENVGTSRLRFTTVELLA
jgi:beta-alanine degradation protein BauB